MTDFNLNLVHLGFLLDWYGRRCN